MTSESKRYSLSELLLDEISFVDRPANPGAKILLYKHRIPAAKSGKPRGKLTMDDIIKAQLAALGVADDQIEKAAEEIIKALGAVFTEEQLTAKIEEAVAKAKDEAKADFDEAVEKAVAEKMAEAAADPDDKIKKNLDPEARERFEKMEAENKANAERIAKMERETRFANLMKRAEPFGKIGEAEEIAKLFERCDDEVVQELDALLTKAAAQLAEADKILTSAKGTSTPTEGSALAKINAKAAELCKANPKLTHHQAFKKVCEDEPTLLAEHRSETTAN